MLRAQGTIKSSIQHALFLKSSSHFLPSPSLSSSPSFLISPEGTGQSTFLCQGLCYEPCGKESASKFEGNLIQEQIPKLGLHCVTVWKTTLPLLASYVF